MISTSITLSTDQMLFAAKHAQQLHDRLRKRGIPDGHGLRKKDATKKMEAGGAQAELAASLMLDVSWTALTNHKANSPDIGHRTQVRSTQVHRQRHHLIIRPRDLQKYGDVPFVLVIQNGREFEIKGWIMSFDAAHPRFLWDGGDRRRPLAWFVPEEHLRPISDLKEV